MSVGKFLAGTTLATPAIGGVGYVTYEQLTKEEAESSTSEENSDTTQNQDRENTSNTAEIRTNPPGSTTAPQTQNAAESDLNTRNDAGDANVPGKGLETITNTGRAGSDNPLAGDTESQQQPPSTPLLSTTAQTDGVQSGN